MNNRSTSKPETPALIVAKDKYEAFIEAGKTHNADMVLERARRHGVKLDMSVFANKPMVQL